MDRRAAVATFGVDPEDRHLAAVALAVALEDLDDGGLAGPVGAEQGEHLTAPHLEVDAPDRLEAPVGLGQTPNRDGNVLRRPGAVANSTVAVGGGVGNRSVVGKHNGRLYRRVGRGPSVAVPTSYPDRLNRPR